MGKEYHVSIKGNDHWEGSVLRPFRTISKAASLVVSGDVVTVHQGEYREWVKPANGGLSDIERIIYRAAKGEKVIIKGSERIMNWENIGGTVWKAVISNEMFEEYHPYRELIEGDWYEFPKGMHTGEVYLNGRAFYEAQSIDEIRNPVLKMEGYCRLWPYYSEKIRYPENTIYQWYSEVDDEYTYIYANFHEFDPNKELVEINVRRSCFYPVKTGRNYITVSGFEMAQAACPWTPPTADQPALLGVNWSKGWIIEDNIIHDAKCSAISIGKEESTGHNLCTRTERKPGYQYQMETVFRASKIGWSKENIGSHVIRRNVIYDCGQNGIVGHLGCIFSQIYDNHIYNIAVKHEFWGHEIAGIKLHTPIDVQICHNHIHHCSLGVWLDWQAQGTRISRNLYYENDRDFMIEVTHGPCLIDNNIFASDFGIENYAQGTAFVHNLFCGLMHKEAVLNRSTPYHFPHSTDIAGTAFVYSADDRFFQNIFLGDAKLPYNVENFNGVFFSGTSGYNGCPTGLEEYVEWVKATGKGDLQRHLLTNQPAYINNNVYLKNAHTFYNEKLSYISTYDPKIQIIVMEDGVYLKMYLEKELFVQMSAQTEIITTETLGTVRLTEQPYENADGSKIIVDVDFMGNARNSRPSAGPFEELTEGWNLIKVWGNNEGCIYSKNCSDRDR